MLNWCLKYIGIKCNKDKKPDWPWTLPMWVKIHYHLRKFIEVLMLKLSVVKE